MAFRFVCLLLPILLFSSNFSVKVLGKPSETALEIHFTERERRKKQENGWIKTKRASEKEKRIEIDQNDSINRLNEFAFVKMAKSKGKNMAAVSVERIPPPSLQSVPSSRAFSYLFVDLFIRSIFSRSDLIFIEHFSQAFQVFQFD